MAWYNDVDDDDGWRSIRLRRRRRRSLRFSGQCGDDDDGDDDDNDNDDGLEGGEERGGLSSQVLRAGRGLIWQSTPVSLKKVCTARVVQGAKFT